MRRWHVHHWPLWLLLLLGCCRPARGQCLECAPPLNPCYEHDCSNDMLGVLDDQAVNVCVCLPSIGHSDPTDIDLFADHITGACVSVPWSGSYGWQRVRVDGCLGEPRPPGNADVRIRVRLRNAWGSSDLNPPADQPGAGFRPFSCLRDINSRDCTTRNGGSYSCHDGCEEPCWTGGPDRLPWGPCP